MKSIITGMLVAAGLMVAGGASAVDMPALAKTRACVACHSIDKKGVGPAWMEVSQKYKGDAGAKARLSEKVSKGGVGVWGKMPMPANPKVTPAEMDELITFILGLAK